jgi:hypothetical protein
MNRRLGIFWMKREHFIALMLIFFFKKMNFFRMKILKLMEIYDGLTIKTLA